MSKKVVTVLVVLSLIFSLVVGCGTSSTPSSTNTAAPSTTSQYGDTGGLTLPIVDKTTDISIVVDCDFPVGDSLMVKEILKRTGIQLKVQEYASAIFSDKMKILLSSNKLPDIMFEAPGTDINTLGMQGALTPINQYFDKLPNFKKTFIDDPNNSWIMKSFTADDNNLYGWPLYDNNRTVNFGMMYRKDIFDANNLKEWTNTEEFYQTLKKLKEIYPNSVPYSSKTKQKIFKDWAPMWGMAKPTYYDEGTKTWKYAALQPAYKDMLDFLKKLYNEGLVDPELFTCTPDAWAAKMTQKDKTFVTYDWIGRMDMYADQVKSQIPEYNLRYTNPIGSLGKIAPLPKISDLNFAFCVANNSNKEISLKFLDYLLSPSGTKLSTMGVEGVTFKKENGKIVYPDFPGKAVGIQDLEQKFGVFTMGLYARVDRESVYFNYTEKEKEAQDRMVNDNKIDVPDPILKFTKDELEKMNEIDSNLLKEEEAFSMKYVTEKSYGEKEWQDWLKKAESLKVNDYVGLYTAAQGRYDAVK